MSNLIPSGTLTMSSREIAELTGKAHPHVIRDIRTMLSELYGDDPNLDHLGIHVLTDARGYTSEIRLPRREVEILVTGYSIPIRAKVIDRLHELEAQISSPVFDPQTLLNDPAAMRGLLLTYTEKVIALEEQVTVLQPKADVLDQISASPGSLTITQAAKELGRHVKWLTQWMNAHRWIYRTNGSWVGYDAHIKNGDLEFKQAKYTDQNGTTQLKPYCHITQQGMVKLARLMHKEAA